MAEIIAEQQKPKRSMRAAINAMCKACIYDPYGGSGTWRQQVEACTSKKCPLFEFRPISAPSEVEEA